MSKRKPFEPSMGYIVTVNVHELALTRVGRELKIDPVLLGQALERAGYKLEPDPFDISADTWKVIKMASQNETTKLEVVKNEPTDNASND